MGILCGLAGLIIVLVGVAVVGHLLWLAGAAVFGASSSAPVLDRCPSCATRLNPGQIHCPKCGFTLSSAHQATLDEELAATRRQLHRLMQTGKIASSTWEQILDALRADVREREFGVAPPESQWAEIQPTSSAEPVRAPSESPAIGPDAVPIAAASAVDGVLAAPTSTPAHVEAAIARSHSGPLPVPPERPLRPAIAPRALADIFQAFLEEKNIRWGELISGQ